MRALTTTTGRHTTDQAELGRRLSQSVADLPDPQGRRRLIGFVHAHSGIQQRHVEVAPGALVGDPDWQRGVQEASLSLSERCLRQLGAADPDGVRDCGALVVVSSTFAGFPAASRVLQDRLQLPRQATCWDLSGLGCAGPTQGLFLAWSLLQQGHDNVIVLFVDAMASFGSARVWSQVPEMSEVVAHCLASDGAAAILIGRTPAAQPVFGFTDCTLQSRLWSDSLDQNDLTVRDGWPYLSVGKQIRTRLVQETGDLLDDDFVAHPAFLHPGGPDLMKRVVAARPQLAATVEVSMAVLERHGNLGSASVVFVLDEALRRSMPLVPRFGVFALGPGIVATRLRVDGVEV
ncbi:MAG: hypothetical protein KTR31_10465 [Myxococcales bacterium]|nr:hypothetical protein [Myxococcales bacterium]